MPILKYYNTRFKVLNEDNEYYFYVNEVDFTTIIQFYTKELFKSDVINFFKQRAFD